MELNVLENTKKRMVFELKGSDHTLCNALKKEMWNDSAVKAAAYRIDHPLVGVPKFIVETNGQKDASAVVKGAISRLQKLNSDFLAAVKKAK